MPIWEMVRNASLRTRSFVIANAATRASMRVRNSLPNQPSVTITWNTRSVVRSSRRATGMRSCS
ncbi:hypothetical protein D3C83_150420 [compost metagenome]